MISRAKDELEPLPFLRGGFYVQYYICVLWLRLAWSAVQRSVLKFHIHCWSSAFEVFLLLLRCLRRRHTRLAVEEIDMNVRDRSDCKPDDGERTMSEGGPVGVVLGGWVPACEGDVQFYSGAFDVRDWAVRCSFGFVQSAGSSPNIANILNDDWRCRDHSFATNVGVFSTKKLAVRSTPANTDSHVVDEIMNTLWSNLLLRWYLSIKEHSRENIDLSWVRACTYWKRLD